MSHQINIVFEDGSLIVVNKPSGLLVTPTPKQERHTLTHLLNNLLCQRKSQVKVHICHRLDRETSGLIVYAKGKSNQQKIMEQFHKRQVRKRYIAFVHGHLKKDNGIIKYSLENRDALTKYHILQCHPKRFSVVEVKPITGRTNQIRIHFKKLGYPLVGERKYAFGRDYALKFRRVALHASYLEFVHPVTGQVVLFHCDLPDDMKRLLNA